MKVIFEPRRTPKVTSFIPWYIMDNAFSLDCEEKWTDCNDSAGYF